MDTKKLEQYIKNNNTVVEKENIITNIKQRLCHHKVRFLSLLINFMNNKIKSYLEIGVHNGCSMAYVLQSKYKVDICYGIDLFKNTFYHDKLDKNYIYDNLQKINKNNNVINLIEGNSTNQDIIQKFKNINIDLIFIDGDHTYDGVKKDFFNYYPFLSDNGLMVFDDFNKANTNKGVYKFINELLENVNTYFKGYYKFIDNEHKHSQYKEGIILFYK